MLLQDRGSFLAQHEEIYFFGKGQPCNMGIFFVMQRLAECYCFVGSECACGVWVYLILFKGP